MEGSSEPNLEPRDTFRQSRVLELSQLGLDSCVMSSSCLEVVHGTLTWEVRPSVDIFVKDGHVGEGVVT